VEGRRRHAALIGDANDPAATCAVPDRVIVISICQQLELPVEVPAVTPPVPFEPTLGSVVMRGVPFIEFIELATEPGELDERHPLDGVVLSLLAEFCDPVTVDCPAPGIAELFGTGVGCA
jgi:hypothetical protein